MRGRRGSPNCPRYHLCLSPNNNTIYSFDPHTLLRMQSHHPLLRIRWIEQGVVLGALAAMSNSHMSSVYKAVGSSGLCVVYKKGMKAFRDNAVIGFYGINSTYLAHCSADSNVTPFAIHTVCGFRRVCLAWVVGNTRNGLTGMSADKIISSSIVNFTKKCNMPRRLVFRSPR